MFDPQQQPFKTSNAVLAQCLHWAGVPFENDKRPCWVFYSAEILKKFTNGAGEPIYRGWALEDAVRDAQKKGRRGHIEYVFKRTRNLDNLLATYKRQVERLEKDDGHASDLVADIGMDLANGTITREVAILRLMCICLKMRIPFVEMWQQQVPLVMIAKPGAATSKEMSSVIKGQLRETKVVTHPGYKVVSLNASPETRKKLGI